MSTLAEQWMEQGLQRGLQRGRLEGRQEGRMEGLMLVLERLLEAKFGAEGLAFAEALSPVVTQDMLETMSVALLGDVTLPALRSQFLPPPA